MITTAIIEDEEDSQFLLSSILTDYCQDVKVVGIASNYKDSIDLLEKEKPNVVFCDIQLEDCTAFQILDRVDNLDFHLIFTTAHDEYAIKAFKYEAVHYLLKPYAPDDVISALDRIEKSPVDVGMLKHLDQVIQKSVRNEKQRLGIPTTEGIEMLNVEDIIRIEADRSYSIIYHSHQKRMVVSRPLKEIEELLPKDAFFRAHSSHLINISHVTKLLKPDGGSIIMSDQSAVPLARRRRRELSEILLGRS